MSLTEFLNVLHVDVFMQCSKEIIYCERVKGRVTEAVRKKKGYQMRKSIGQRGIDRMHYFSSGQQHRL